MLYLHFAPSLDMLVPDLLAEVREVWTDPFAAPDILVPSPALGKWLRMRLADGQVAQGEGVPPFGCAANLAMPTIEKYLWNLLQPGDFRQLDQHCLQQIVGALLDEACIGLKEFKPVKDYLSGPSGIDPLKRVQISARIAHQYLEYEYNRPGVWRKDGLWNPQGIDGTWMRRKRYTDDNIDEPWQAELYRRVRACLAKATDETGDTPEKYLSLPQLYRRYREGITPSGAPLKISAGTIFMFGVTKVSHFHRNLFVEISQIEGTDLHVYLTNPCAEFWEDVNTSRSNWRRSWNHASINAAIPARTRDDFNREELSGIPGAIPEDHRLLELWGGAGKENIFLWCQDAQWNFDYRSPDRIEHEDPPQSFLQSLQDSLLRRATTMRQPVNGWDFDGSLQIVACPDRGREMEELRERILDMVHDGTISMLNEVVVYLTDTAAYVPAIQRVFGAVPPHHPEYIPFCISGTAGKSTCFTQGVVQLLEILRNRFDRAHIFGLLRNPIVQATRGFSAESVTVWEQWAEALSMFRGFTVEHRKEMGDTGLALTDVHTFEFGMARMLLSDLTEGAGVLHFVEHANRSDPDDVSPLTVLPYRDFEISDREQLEAFCAAVEALYLDGERLRKDVDKSIGDGVATLRDLVNKWFGNIPDTTVTDIAAEGGMLRSFYDALSVLSLQQRLAGRTSVPFEEFVPMALGCLPEESAAGSGVWTGGITFAPLRPAMVIPHNVVFAAGLDDVLFPGSNERPSWDLLSRKRIIGDSDRVRDNRFAFLELLHAARKKLILSYRAKDMQKECELHPASVLQELEAYLAENGAAPKVISKAPTDAFRYELPWIVHESLPVAVANGRKHGTWNRTARRLASLSANERTKNRYELAVSKTVAPTHTTSFRVNLYDLSCFFNNPLEYHLSRTLGIELDETPATLSAADEPLDSGNLAIVTMQKGIWATVLRSLFPENAGEAHDDRETLAAVALQEAIRRYRLHTAAGGAPEAMPGQMERDFLVRWASLCVEKALPLTGTFSDHRFIENCNLSLGRDGRNGLMNIPMASGASCTVEVHHRMALLPRNGASGGTAGIIAVKKDGKAADNPGLWLEGMVQWLFEAAEGSGGGAVPLTLVQLNYSDCSCNSYRFHDDFTRADRLLQWFTGFIEQMANRCSDHLPFSVIQKLVRRKSTDPLTWPQRLAKISRHGIEEKLTGRYGYTPFLPVFNLVDAQLPELSDAGLRSLIDKRYAPMLDGWLMPEEAAA